ncbi:MAG TPA: glycosyltransferase [Alcaligenes sp.]|nr:glycosyltransferase [Alcaligenes sp.]HRL27257.1 glycosyltransferase [Alcaligenes sp.]
MNGLPSAASTPLRVVHIISGLGQGGAETVLFRLATAPGQDTEHIVVSLGGEDVFGPQLRQAGIELHCLHMKSPWRFLKGLRALVKLLDDMQPDVVQTWMYHSDLVGGAAARIAQLPAVSWGIRNSGANLYQGSPKARLVAWLCARVSRIIPNLIVSCAENAARRHKQWGYRADIMKVIPNGYDLSRWHPDAQAREQVRSELGLALDTPVIGSVARWNPLKDHPNLLAALARSLRRHPGLRCLLIGDGMDSGNEALMRLLDQHQLHESVILMGRRSDVPRLMNALDVHVLSSSAEGFPNVVCEAMAAGVSNVVTDVGDAALIVGNEGWVVPPRHAEALSGAINSAVDELGSPSWQARHEHARERVARLFSLQGMVNNYTQAWTELAAAHPPKRKRPRRTRTVSDSALARGAEQAPRKLMFVVNNPAFFLSHRLPLALAAQREGYQVHVATMDGEAVGIIEQHGLIHHALPMTRSGTNPVQEARTVWALWRLFRSERPDVVHAVTIKPVLYGGIAARLAGVPGFLAAISGLGYVFTGRDKGVDPIRWIAVQLYRLALGHAHSRVIFQNSNDRDVLLQAGVVRSGQCVMIRGSGVDLDQFRDQAEPDGPPVAFMVARLLADKGVREFVEAARISARQGSQVQWVLAGSPDPGNPASITQQEWENWRQEGVVQCLGERRDVAQLYAQSHIAVLPSYREGLPKSLVEAAACGRAVVTTDVPGCRDAIEPGVTGLLVPVRDAQALARAVQELADDPARRRAMGAQGRRLAEQAFDIQRITEAHLDLYQQLSPLNA